MKTPSARQCDARGDDERLGARERARESARMDAIPSEFPRQQVRVVRSKRAMRARDGTARARADGSRRMGRRVEGTTREGERDDAWEREDD